MNSSYFRTIISFFVLLFSFASASLAFAHGGGLDRNGCHTNHKTGEYHCHRKP